MKRLRTGLIWNVAGLSWGRILAIFTTPLYISILGIEPYGLIGIYLMLMGASQLFDFGLNLSVNRQVAIYKSSGSQRKEIPQLVRTIELIYFPCLGAILLVVLVVLENFGGSAFFQSTLSDYTIFTGLRYGVVAVFLNILANFYYNVLLGLELHKHANAIRVFQSSLLHAGGALAVWVSGSVIVFFQWQAIAMLFVVIIVLFTFWRDYLALVYKFVFFSKYVQHLFRLSAGVAGISVLGFVFSQIDRLMLSVIISLENFGYYTLAFTVANGLSVFVIPAFNTILPQITRAVHQDRTKTVDALYRISGIAITLFVAPPALAISLLPDHVIFAWTGNLELVSEAAGILIFLSLGALAQAWTNPPWLVQLAYGIVRVELRVHILLVVVTPPFILMMLWKFGLPGAAGTVAAAHLLHLSVTASYVHGRLVASSLLRYVTHDLIAPALPAMLPLVAVAWLAESPADRLDAAVVLFGGLLASTGLAWLVALPRLRKSGRFSQIAPPPQR